MNPWLTHILRVARPHAGWLLLLPALPLTLLGIQAIHTAAPGSGLATKQAVWLLFGLVAMAVCLLPRPRTVGRLSYAMALLVVALLVFLILPGVPRWLVPVQFGTTAWIDLGFMMFQPAEAAKIAMVLALAWYLRFRDSYRRLPGLLVPFVILLVPVGLILKQPDLGTAMVFPPTLMIILLAAGARLRHLGALLGLGLLVVAVNVFIVVALPDSMQILKRHQRARIIAMVSQIQGDDRYIQDLGYHQHMTQTILGAGGVRGYGAAGSQTLLRFNHLPLDHNDMIFAVVVNRWGLLGGAAVLMLLLTLILMLMWLAGRVHDPFARLALVGFAGLLFSQSVINLGVALGLLPVTGITLPLVSYGGTSLAATYAMLGLAINLAAQPSPLITRASFEFPDDEQNA